MKAILSFIVVSFLCSSVSFADDDGILGTYTIIIKKQEKKKRSRWSIESWLETKAKFALWDRWLAMNSSDTNFEMFLGGAFLPYEAESTSTSGAVLGPTGDFKQTRGQLGFFYKIFGLQADYIDSDEESKGWNASAHLRLLGTGIQNSNFTIGYGLRHREETFASQLDEFDNQYAEASLTIYILSALGIEGAYRHILAADSQNDVALSGSEVEGTVFFEFSFLRIFGTWFKEGLEAKRSSETTNIERTGVLGGLRFYF